MKRILLAIAALGLMLTIGFSLKAANEYATSCTSCSKTMRSGQTYMYCSCKKCNGTINRTSINVTKPCAVGIRNCDGVLKCVSSCPRCP